MSSTSKLIVSVCLALAVNLGSTARGQQQNTSEPALTSRQEAIVPISAYAAKGDQVNLKVALAKGLEAGLTVNEIKEILVQLYAYAGFPRSLNAISTFQTVVNDRKQIGKINIEGKKPAKINFNGNKYQFGKEVQAKLTGRSANSTQAFVPVIDTFLKEHLFADIFGRNNLDYQSREIATISILATIGNADAQLGSHLSVGRNTGLTEGQLRGIAAQLSTAISPDAGNSATRFIDAMYGAKGNVLTSASAQVKVSEPTFSKGNKVSNGNFTGDVWVSMLTSVDTANSTSVGNVTFAPKARSNWHLHPSGQILLITDGVGYYQEKGQPIRLIRKGDVIKCAANVAHWHGASRDSSMSHIALGPNNGKGVVVWMERVTDEEYAKFN
ncbi:carboxymuconolactone decarboxylase family protein [Mucilaginibacter sp.]|jgi:quercetin dioxygenase-like cupin family protein/alkylhydroperoxidase/carboxymuconolactone decarboxylase family protein YurZ|uniref:carboxymuconolactone decarboxylase family protein n=1 Tax=Mucilaginibacter sp. TaxID=1882438 RepID=UPI00356A2616